MSRPRGLETFRRFFEGFADQYVLIGGAANYLALAAAGLDARATKDLDIVLLAEVSATTPTSCCERASLWFAQTIRGSAAAQSLAIRLTALQICLKTFAEDVLLDVWS